MVWVGNKRFYDVKIIWDSKFSVHIILLGPGHASHLALFEATLCYKSRAGCLQQQTCKLTSPKYLLFAPFLGMFAKLWAKTIIVFKWASWRRGRESKGAEGDSERSSHFCVCYTQCTFVWEAKLVHNRLKSVFSLVVPTWFGNGGLQSGSGKANISPKCSSNNSRVCVCEHMHSSNQRSKSQGASTQGNTLQSPEDPTARILLCTVFPSCVPGKHPLIHFKMSLYMLLITAFALY